MQRLFAGEEPRRGAALSRDELLQRLRKGGLPTLALTGAPEIIYPEYFAEYLEGVAAHELERRVDQAELIRLARFLCGSTSRLLNVSSVANELGSTRETVAARLATLESLFVLHPLRAHRPNEHKVLLAHPKVHAVDSGMASWAAGGRFDDAHVFGALVETFVVNEQTAQASWIAEGVEIRHWRDTAKKVEVDAVAVRSDGAAIAFEVKAAADVRPDDLHGLRAYLSADPHATRGVVFYTGGRILDLDDGIQAIPISCLWKP